MAQGLDLRKLLAPLEILVERFEGQAEVLPC
jgi:hypothetical protein